MAQNNVYHPFQAQQLNIGVQHSQMGLVEPTLPRVLLTQQPNALNGTLFMLLDMKQNSAQRLDNTETKYRIQKPHFPAFTVQCDIGKAGCGAVNKLVTDNTSGILANQTYKNECTGEHIRITAVPEDGCVYAERGVGTIGGLPMRKGDKLSLVSNSFEESSLRPLPTHTGYTEIEFSTMISRNSWGVSQTEAARKSGRVVQSVNKSKMEGAWNHFRDVELALWFSEQSEGERNGQPFKTIDGFDALVHKYAPENVFYAPATTNFEQLSKMLNSTKLGLTPAGMGSADAVMVGGQAVLEVINQIVASKGSVQFQQGQTSYGFNFSTIVTSTGSFHFMYNRLFDVVGQPGTLRVMNLDTLDLFYLANRKHQHSSYHEGGVANSPFGVDAQGGDFLSEFTLHMLSPKSNAIIYGLCRAGCSATCVFTGWEPLEMTTDMCGRLMPKLHEDDRLIYACENNTCPTSGVPFPEIVPDPIKDACGNLVPAPACTPATTWVQVKCKALTTIETSAGTITFEGDDYSDAAQLTAAQEVLTDWLAANGGGAGTIAYAKGLITVTIKDSTQTFGVVMPTSSEFQCQEKSCD